jgi:MFS family permease
MSIRMNDSDTAAAADKDELREPASGKKNQHLWNDDDDDADANGGDDDKTIVGRARRRLEDQRRRWLFGFSAIYTFLYVGSFFGWGPMQLLLEENGSFSWKCPATSADSVSSSVTSSGENTSVVCPEQTYALLRINLIATVTQILSPALGQFVDCYGAKRGFFVFTASLWIGLALLTIAASARSLGGDKENNNYGVVVSTTVVVLDRLLYVAFCFMAMATWMGGLLTVHTGLFFTGHARSRVIFTLNSLFDSGSITYLFLWWLQSSPAFSNHHVSLTVLAAGFLCSAVIISSGALYLWVVTVPQQDEEIETTTALTHSTGEIADVSEKAGSSTPHPTSPANTMHKDKQQEMIQEVAMQEAEESIIQQPSLVSLDQYVIVADRTPRQQLLSAPYLLLGTYFAIHTTSNQWNLATQRDFLAYLGDDEQGNKYLTIFTLLMPASIVALPLVDYAIFHFGFSGAFQTINILSLGYTIIKVSSQNLNVQILGFILFSFYRCFLFGISISFLPTLIGPNVVGKAVGILYAVAGIMSFINIPFAKLAVEQLDGNFFIPNLVFCLLGIPCILLAFLIGCRIRQEDRAKSRQDDVGPKSVHKRMAEPIHDQEEVQAVSSLR